MLKNTVGSATLVRLVQDHRRPAALMAGVLVAVVAALLAFGVAERSAAAQSEPETVGAVTGLTASAEGQPPGTVHLTWNAAENAQVYFVLFVKADDLASGNYAGIQMRAFNGTEATIDGLEGGASYHFIARGMRYNISVFKDFWGAWSGMTTVAAAGVADGTATTPDESQLMPAEPQTVGVVTGLTITAEGQPPGSVHLIWNAAENAQVYFVLFVKADDLAAGNYTGVQMRVFNDTESTIDGLEGGASYHFIARGMRYNISTFKEVWGDNWSSMTTATPYAEPTFPLSELEHWDRLEEDKPALANQLKALPWVADGVGYSEREAAEALIAAAIWYPDTFNALLQMAWVVDSVTTHETTVIRRIRWTAKDAPALAEPMLQKSWVQDGITRDEAIVIEHLYWTIRVRDESLQQEVIQKAIEILAMPFLDTVESPDAMAVWDLEKIENYRTSDFLSVMSHPKVSDGITNQEAKIVAALSSANRYKPASLPILLDGLDGTGGVCLEERGIELDLSGEVQLTIIRVIDKDTPNMDRLEHAVRVVEEFMGEPLPTNYVAWYLDDAARSAGKGYHAGTHITSSLVYDIVDGDSKSRTPMQHIAHEVGHYYFRGNTHQWLDEGPAKFFESISERERVGRPVAYFKQSCGPAKTIQEQEHLRNDISAGLVTAPDGWTQCDYYLGERFFVDLYLAMGDEAFRPGLRSLYLKSQHDDPNDDCEGTDLSLCHVEAAFKTGASDEVMAQVDGVIDRWYYGTLVSFSDLERADRLEPEFANQLKALPWIADGIDYAEREAAQMLIDAARVYPDTFSALLQKPWVTDDDLTAAETNAIHGIRWTAKYAPAVSEQMLQISWVQDDITEAEGEVIYRLYRTAREDPELAGAILDMPFLETFEPDDALAVSAISYMERRGEDHLEVLKQSQIFKDGITDDLTTLVRAAGTIRDADALAQWLVPGYASIEVHTGQTELTPELKISIFRDHDDPQPETMPELVRIAKQLESLMQVPLPNPRLVFVISDQAPLLSTNGIGQGKRYDFAYGLRGDREDTQRFASQYATNRPMLPSVIIHEIGHDYYGNEIKSWLNHTPIKAGFEYIYRLDGRDPSEAPEQVLNVIQRRGCEARNIQHLEEMNFPSSDRGNTLCHHYFGYWMGRELLEAVGQDEFMARMRRLYHLKNKMVSEGADPGIAEIRELFPDQLEIVERYWSGDVGNPEEQYWGGLANLFGHPMEHAFGCCCAGCMPVDA